MKLISLKVKAFGPFRNQEIIEFNKLGEDPLFLIDGPTGAGKSSILNAISFALYGDLADKDRNNEGLRCDFSDDDIETLVTLKFQLRGVIYQITRSPTQVVRKKVGEGFRERPGEAELLKMGENGFEVLVPRKMKEATERIEQIVGLDKNQFTQVMVLPQGKFRELLLASSDERQKILSTLFGTKRFKEIELLLKEKSKEIIKKYEYYQSKVDSVLKSFDLKYNEVDKLDKLIEEEKKNLKISKEEKDKSQKKREESSNKLEVANNILKTFYLLDQKKEEFSNSLEKKKKNELIKEKVFEAEEARKIKIYFNRFSDCEKKILSVQKDISFIKIERNKSKQKLEAANSNFLKAEASLKKKDAFIAKGVELNSFFEKSTALENTFLKYKEIKKSLEIEEANYLKLKKEKKKNSEELKDIETEVKVITNTLSQKSELVKKENDLQGKLTKKRELNDLEDIKNKQKQSLSLLEENFSKINEGLIKAQEEADLLEMNWHSN
ncbi:MAG: AAA family ATPase, partial [Bdellovibrionota bacterium]|nr:AAA family ATPase [Bdellovibrionota bacterium]